MVFAEISSFGTLLVLGMLVPVAAFAAGCAVAAWLIRAGGSQSVKPASSNESESEVVCTVERAMMASERIKDLAKHAVSHVGDHGSKVEEFNSNLQAIAGQPSEFSVDTLVLAIGQMTCANTELKQRLMQIEKQIDAQASELRSYSSEARTDSLTGLANRRAFDDEIQRRFAEWQRRRAPFTLMILDVDNFKPINDSYGHLAGDEALRQIGKVITDTSRQMDFRCRYGGDEFVVVMPDTSLQEARAAAERMRKSIESTVIKFGDVSISLTCSFGIARVAVNDKDVSQIVRRADESLYKSKDAGRNCGHWHDGQACLPLETEAKSSTNPSEAAPPIVVLAGRLEFVEALQLRMVESQRFGVPLSIMHLCVNNYAALCQAYGAAAAGTTLDAVASFTQAALRPCDRLARLEDGELVALLPGSTQNEANQIAKRLHLSAANCDVQLHHDRVHLNMTHGIAEFRPGDSAESMMAQAQAAADAEAAQVTR